MAKYNKGVLGSFNGKVGTVVGSTWKGIDFMRSVPKKSKRNAPDQLVQQAKFALASRFLTVINDVVRIGFREVKGALTGRNSALSHILKTAISGTYPDFALDFTQVEVSNGSLPNASNPHASVQAGKIRFEWVNNSGTSKATVSDNALLLLYSEELQRASYTVTGGRRDAQVADYWDPAFNGHSVQAWIAFISPNGKLVSRSIHVGQFLID